MTITAALVKELRERTGAGMMECKKALVAADGDLDAAADNMRKSGLAKADKKAARVAADGAVVIAQSADGRRGVLVEVNSETDFVANREEFRNFATEVARVALELEPPDSAALLAASLGSGDSVDEGRRALVAALGENINVRRFDRLEAENVLGAYVHHNARSGVLIALRGGDEGLARDLAMHVAANNPSWIAAADVPEETLAKEREILAEQARQEGKPEEIVARMVDGRLRKYLKEITLLGQPFVKDPDINVERLLSEAGAEVTAFIRYGLGEGIEQKQEDFAAEVMAQVRGAE